MKNLKIEAPWYTYNKMLKALFEKDPDIVVGDIHEVENSDYDYVIDIEVKNHEKFVALDRVILAERDFGNISVGIVLYDEENTVVGSAIDIYKTIFNGNPIVKDTQIMVDPAGVEHGYVEFVPEVVQFFDDDLSDFNGNWNGLAEDIAREVFFDSYNGVNFCTAVKEK